MSTTPLNFYKYSDNSFRMMPQIQQPPLAIPTVAKNVTQENFIGVKSILNSDNAPIFWALLIIGIISIINLILNLALVIRSNKNF